jgi:hypothetical protein
MVRVKGLHESAQFGPKHYCAVDARFALALQATLRLPHRRRKNCQQHVTIVSSAQLTLQVREPICRHRERRFERFKSLERVPQPLARDAEVMQASPSPVLELAG